MPTATADDGVTLRYEFDGGTGSDSNRPAIAFIPDAGGGPWMWGWQAPALAGSYRILVYAARGTDGSDRSGPYTVDRFVSDLDVVLTAAEIPRVHLVGAGLGGMVALRYAREYGRARSLSLFGVADSGDRIDEEALSRLHPPDSEAFGDSLSVGFTAQFLSETAIVDRIVEWRREEDATGKALSGHMSAALNFEAGPLYELRIPALVCHGVEDPVVPVDAGQALGSGLPRGRFELIEGKRCCYIEHATVVTDEIDGFIESVEER